jgi:hypothetical protein
MKSAQRWNILGGVVLSAALLWVTGTAIAGADLTLQDSYTNPGDPSGYGPQPGDPRPSQDPTKGWIEGTLTAASGEPLASMWVTAQERSSGMGTSAMTAANGRYRVSNLSPGPYIVSFQTAPYLIQWAHQRVRFEPDVFDVRANQATVVDDTALPTGTITGRFTPAEGQDGAGVLITVSPPDGNGPSVYGGVRADGTFSIPVFAGAYKVEFTLPGGVHQYAYQQLDRSKAATITVAAGATVVVNDSAVPTGGIAGHLTENDGKPAANAHVSLYGNGQSFWATAGVDGAFAFPLAPVGDYTLSFSSPDYARAQYAFHTIDESQAAAIQVTAGRTTTVDDTFLPTGSLQVTAADEAGQPLTDFCAYISAEGPSNSACSHGSTTITLSGLPEGTTYYLYVYSSGPGYLGTEARTVTITGGQVTTKAVVMRKAAVIQATILDKVTRQPVANACVATLTLQAATRADGYNACSDQGGHVEVSLPADKYTLFVAPQDGVHGAQWVGASGGTGSQYLAKQVNAVAGSVTVAPTVYLDPAGSIAGTVTEADTGKPIPTTCVNTTAIPSAWFHLGGWCQGLTDTTGHYQIDGLGPYAWPVGYAAVGHPWQWSGGTGSRLLAAPVKVTAGQTTTSNAAISKGSAIKGRVLHDGAGTGAQVQVYDVLTGDAVGDYTETTDGGYEVRVLPGLVRVSYSASVGPRAEHWYRNAADFKHATPVLVGSRPTNLDLVIPTS